MALQRSNDRIIACVKMILGPYCSPRRRPSHSPSIKPESGCLRTLMQTAANAGLGALSRRPIKHQSDILARTSVGRLTVLAHSTGSLRTKEGLWDAQLTGLPGQRKRFENVRLAARDTDLDPLWTQVALLSPWLCEWT